MTSEAQRLRRASYAASWAEPAGSSRPAFQWPCAAASPPSQSASSCRYAAPSADDQRPIGLGQHQPDVPVQPVDQRPEVAPDGQRQALEHRPVEVGGAVARVELRSE